MHLNNLPASVMLMVTMVAAVLHIPAVTARGNDARDRTSGVTAVLELSKANQKSSFTLGEPVFVTVHLAKSSKDAKGETRIPAIGSAGNPRPWQVSRDGISYVSIGVTNAATSSPSIVLKPGDQFSVPATMWFRNGRPRPLVFNESGTWYIRVSLNAEREGLNQPQQYQSRALTIHIRPAPKALQHFVDNLGTIVGDRVTVPSTQREAFLRPSAESNAPLVKRYAKWLLIRSYLGDANWLDAVEQRQPEALLRLEHLIALAKTIDIDADRDSPLFFDIVSVQAWGAVFSDRFDEAAAFTRQVPRGYDPYWIARLREWLEEEYQPEKSNGLGV